MPVLRYVFYPFACALAVVVIVDSHEADRLLRLAAEMQSLSGATRMAWASLLERLSFSWYSGATDLAEAYQMIVAAAHAAQARALHASLAAGALAVLHLAVVRLSSPAASLRLAWHLNLAAALAFVVGVAAPMLTVVAHSTVPVLGQVILRHETKSILSTIAELVTTGNWLLAGAIAAFSIAVPLFKLVLVCVALMPLAAGAHERAMSVLNAVGKWSMADVFVVAVLVAYLALNKDVYSRAELGLGLYFFAAYCALSMLAAVLAGKAGAVAGGERV